MPPPARPPRAWAGRLTGLALALLATFDLRRDPAERRNLFDAVPTRAAAVRDRLVRAAGSEALATSGWGEPLRWGDESKQLLKALGYH